MPRYTPELIASIHHDYVNEPDKSVAAIAADHHTSDRTIHRIVRRYGWTRRSALTPTQPMQLQRQARALLAQRTAPAEPAGTERDAEAALAAREVSASERIQRLVEQELAAEEAARATLGIARAHAGRGGALRAHARDMTQYAACARRACAASLAPEQGARTMTTCPQTSMNSVANLRAALTRSSQAGLEDEMLERVPELRRWTVDRDFAALAHPHQEPPAAANNGGPWTTWLVLGGRGAGKTRLGAEWVRALALRHAALRGAPHGHIALVGETEHDVREVMIEGVSGPAARRRRARERPVWIADAAAARMAERRGRAGVLGRGSGELARAAVRRRLVRRAREVAAAPTTRSTCCSSACGSGARPRQLITTTPRPIRADQAADRRSAHRGDARRARRRMPRISRPRSSTRWSARYAGTRLGRQEIDGEIIEDRPDALWSRAMIEACRVAAAPPLARIVVGIDPPAGVAAGLGRLRHRGGGARRGRHDLRAGGRDRRGACARRLGRARRSRSIAGCEADTLVAEVNQGGDMVRAVLRQVDASVPLKTRARDARQVAARRAGRRDVRAGHA